MGKHFFDYDDGSFGMSLSGNMLIDSDGDLMMKMSDNMAMDMDSGGQPIKFCVNNNPSSNNKISDLIKSYILICALSAFIPVFQNVMRACVNNILKTGNSNFKGQIKWIFCPQILSKAGLKQHPSFDIFASIVRQSSVMPNTAFYADCHRLRRMACFS